MMKQAEVSAYFKRFDEADRLYLDMDRRWEEGISFTNILGVLCQILLFKISFAP